MGEKYLGQLTAKSAPATGDIMVLEDSEDTKKIDYDALANAILNKLTTKTYTVGGETQTLISAIDTLNSKYKWQFNVTSTITSQAENLPDGKTMYFGTVSGYGNQTELDSPDNTNAYVEVYRWSAAYITIKWASINGGLNGNVYTRTKNGSVWGEWIKLPTRAEMDALNSKTTVEAINITAESGITNNLFVRKQSGIITINGYIASSSAFGTNQTVATIPAGACPIAPVRSTCALVNLAYNSPGSMGYVSVDTDGKIVVTAPSNNTYKTAYFSLSYMAQL